MTLAEKIVQENIYQDLSTLDDEERRYELTPISMAIACTEAALDRSRYLLKKIQETIDVIESKYKSQCADADWYNNNMPNVGGSLDYKSKPPYPKELTILKKLLEDYSGFYE